MKRYLKPLLVVIVLAFIGLGAHNLIANKQEQDQLQKQLQTEQLKRNETQQQLEHKEGEHDKTLQEKQQLEQQRLEQEQKIKELEQQLSVKRDNARKLANAVTFTQTANAAPASKSCEAYLAAAGITDPNARELMRRENSGCNPQLYNTAGSGACGIAQELPCGKSGCGIPPNADGACQVRWMANYVVQCYGSWAGAIAFHNINNWY